MEQPFLLILEESMLVALSAACNTRPTPCSKVRVMHVVLVDLLLGRLMRCSQRLDSRLFLADVHIKLAGPIRADPFLNFWWYFTRYWYITS